MKIQAAVLQQVKDEVCPSWVTRSTPLMSQCHKLPFKQCISCRYFLAAESAESSEDIDAKMAETLGEESKGLKTELNLLREKEQLRQFLKQQVKTYLHLCICQFVMILLKD